MASEPAVANYLDMPGWSTTEIEYRRHETVVHAVLATELTHCLNKNCESKNIKSNGPGRELYVSHTPVDGRPRRIVYRRKHYYCKDCRKTSLQPVPGLYGRTRMTRRLRRYIVRQALLPEVSFNGLAAEVGRSSRSIRKIFKEHVTHLEKIRGIEAPRVMGIDGVYISRKESLIVTDLEHKRIVMLRPSIKERPVAKALREMQNLDEVEEVVADMAATLDRVQREVLPLAVRTKDRYHVQRMANAAVDEVRKALTPGRRERKKGQMGMCRSHLLRKRRHRLKGSERAELDWCLGLYPELRLTYDVKEAFCLFFDQANETTSRPMYADWLKLHQSWKKEMPKDMQKAFDPLIRAMKNWGEGIFNYFRARRTNAFTESANARVKELTRKAPRAKLETISAKVVHGRRLAQQRRAAREKGKKPRRRKAAGAPQPVAPSKPINTNVDRKKPRGAEMLAVPPTSGPAAAGGNEQEQGLAADRILEIKQRLSKTRRESLAPSTQASLFE